MKRNPQAAQQTFTGDAAKHENIFIRNPELLFRGRMWWIKFLSNNLCCLLIVYLSYRIIINKLWILLSGCACWCCKAQLATTWNVCLISLHSTNNNIHKFPNVIAMMSVTRVSLIKCPNYKVIPLGHFIHSLFIRSENIWTLLSMLPYPMKDIPVNHHHSGCGSGPPGVCMNESEYSLLGEYSGFQSKFNFSLAARLLRSSALLSSECLAK